MSSFSPSIAPVTTESPRHDEVPYEQQTNLFRQIGRKDWEKAMQALHDAPYEARIWIVTKYRGGGGGGGSAALLGPTGNNHALSSTKDEEEVEDVTVWYRRLPLHHACSSKNVPAAFVEALWRVYPEAMGLKDETGKVPLIHACRRETHINVVKAVMTELTAQQPDEEGKCALHWACEYRSSVPLIKLLVEMAPSILQHKDAYGRLPLHWECSVVSERKDKMAVVSYLVQQYPEAVAVLDRDGRSPLKMIDVSDVFELLQSTSASLSK